MIRLLVLFIWLMSCCNVYAMSPVFLYSAVGGESAVSCATTSTTCLTTVNQSVFDFGEVSGTVWMATRFVADDTVTICKAGVSMKRIGSPGFNIRLSIYTDSGGKPNTLVGDWSDNVASSAVGTSNELVIFDNFSAALTDTIVYWLVLNVDGVGDASNKMSLDVDTGCDTADPQCIADNDGTGWDGSSINTRGGRFKLYE